MHPITSTHCARSNEWHAAHNMTHHHDTSELTSCAQYTSSSIAIEARKGPHPNFIVPGTEILQRPHCNAIMEKQQKSSPPPASQAVCSTCGFPGCDVLVKSCPSGCAYHARCLDLYAVMKQCPQVSIISGLQRCFLLLCLSAEFSCCLVIILSQGLGRGIQIFIVFVGGYVGGLVDGAGRICRLHCCTVWFYCLRSSLSSLAVGEAWFCSMNLSPCAGIFPGIFHLLPT